MDEGSRLTYGIIFAESVSAAQAFAASHPSAGPVLQADGRTEGNDDRGAKGTVRTVPGKISRTHMGHCR